MGTSPNNAAPLNVIWILVDSVRNYRSGGDDRDKLDIMEKLGPRCIDFETVVTSAPSSLMSFSAMMTATPAYLIARDFDNFFYDKSAFSSLGGVLKDQGYHTYGVLQYIYARDRLGGKAIDLVGSEHFPPGLSLFRSWTNDEVSQVLFSLLDAGLEEPFFLCAWFDCRGDSETSQKVEKAIDRLKADGLYDRSVFILCSDHGYPDPSRGMGPEWFHRRNLTHDLVLSDDNILTPLYMDYPGATPRKITTPVYNLDIAPTILDLVGLPGAMGNLSVRAGQSLVPLFRGETPSHLVDRKFRSDARYMMQSHRRTAIRGDRWKYTVSHDDGVEEFYDVRADKTEDHNLIDNPELSTTIDEYRLEFRKTEDIAVGAHLEYLVSRNKDLHWDSGESKNVLVLYSQVVPRIELLLEGMKQALVPDSVDVLATVPLAGELTHVFRSVFRANGHSDLKGIRSEFPALRKDGYDMVIMPVVETRSKEYKDALVLGRKLGRGAPVVIDPNLRSTREKKHGWQSAFEKARRRRGQYMEDPGRLLRDVRRFLAKRVHRTRQA